jgi:hypothetical protein
MCSYCDHYTTEVVKKIGNAEREGRQDRRDRKLRRGEEEIAKSKTR